MSSLSDPFAFAQRLRTWYQRHRRNLPWREKPSLYKTVVSEFMLQQTQVATVLPYFKRWLRVFPNFATLATASGATVLRHWEGLGYYNRARNLHRLAQHLQTLATLPTTPQAWQQFPGIGPYSSAAITSIAFGHPTVVVDGNVIRILTRLTAESTLFNDRTAATRHVTPLANQLFDRSHPGDYNQGMMELGATVCLKQNPLCLLCPVRSFCIAGRQGNPETFPRFAARRIQRVTLNRLWIEKRQNLLLHRRPHGARRLANICELPTNNGVLKQLNYHDLLMRKHRGISHQCIEERIYRAIGSPALYKTIAADTRLFWVPFSKINTITLSGPHRKWINEILEKRR